MGDEVLRILASRLGHNVRAADTDTRHDGDEFIIRVPGMARPEETEHLAEKISHALAEPIEIDRREINLTVMIGIASYPANGKTADKLIAAKELSMHHVHSTARNLLYRASLETDA